MVIDIIMIKKVPNNTTPGSKSYPPAVIALLVASILEFFWCLFYLVRSARAALLRASAIAGTVAFLLIFVLGE